MIDVLTLKVLQSKLQEKLEAYYDDLDCDLMKEIVADVLENDMFVVQMNFRGEYNNESYNQ